MDINIATNGTIEGTVLTVDGKVVSKNEKIVSIDLWATAPYKSEFSGETVPGRVSVGYEKVGDDGTVERIAVSTNKDRSTVGIGQKIKNKDQIVRTIGQIADVRVVELTDKIIDHCTKNKIKVCDRETLLNRTVGSLECKCADLGLDLTKENK